MSHKPRTMSSLRMITSPCSITAYIDERADDHLRHANGDLEQAVGTFLYEILRSPKLVQGLLGYDALRAATKGYLETHAASERDFKTQFSSGDCEAKLNLQ